MATAPPLPPGFVPVQPSAAPLPRVIEGPPREPPPQTPAQAEADTLANELARLRIADAAREAQERTERAGRSRRDAAEVRGELQGVIDAARRARQRSAEGWFQTGVGADWIGANTPEGRALRGDIDVIASNTAFDRLQRMRTESPTGGALGSITERELQLLQNTVASLDPGQNDADFQRNMDTIIARYQGILDRLPAEGRGSQPPATVRAPLPSSRVAFNDEAQRPTPETPPGGEAFAADLQARLLAGEFRRPEEIIAYGRDHGGFRIDPQQADAAIRALRNRQPVRVAPARYSGEQAEPGISDARGGTPSLSLTVNGLNVNSEGIDAIVRGAADVLTLGLSDEIAAGADTLFGRGGTYAENLYRQRGIDEYDEQNNFVPRLSGQVAGGFALPLGGASSAAELARVGAGYGAAYGFGSGEGGTDRLLRAGEGALVGGAAAGSLGLLSARLARSGGDRNNSSRAAELAQMAENQGVEVTSPDLNPGQRSTYSFLESLPGAGGRVRADLQRGAQQMETRVAEVGAGAERGAQNIPGAVPRQTAGQTILDTSRRYIARSRDVVGKLYDRAARLAGDAQISPANAVTRLDEHLAQLAETPSANSSKLSVLNQLRADLVDEAGNPRSLSIGAFRDLRSAMREELAARGLRFSNTERRVMQVIDAAGQDIEAGLSGSALRAYRRADQSHRERANLVDNVYQRFVGANRNRPNSPEQAMTALENMAAPRAGDAGSLTQMAGRLRPEERQELASHIASTLGRAGTEGEAAFSPSRFFSQVQRYSDEARVAIWGRRGARDLAELAALAEARSGTVARLNNSGSGRVSNWFRGITTLLSGGGAGAGLGALTGVGAGAGSGVGMAAVPVVLGGAYLRARALGNPRIVSILAAAARAETPQAQSGVLRSLAELSAREPQLAADILPIQRALETTVGRAAAEQEDDRR